MVTYKIIETVEREITEQQALEVIASARKDQLSPTFPLGCCVRVLVQQQDGVYRRSAGVVTDVTFADAVHLYTVSVLANGRVKDLPLHASDIEPLERDELVA